MGSAALLASAGVPLYCVPARILQGSTWYLVLDPQGCCAQPVCHFASLRTLSELSRRDSTKQNCLACYYCTLWVVSRLDFLSGEQNCLPPKAQIWQGWYMCCCCLSSQGILPDAEVCGPYFRSVTKWGLIVSAEPHIPHPRLTPLFLFEDDCWLEEEPGWENLHFGMQCKGPNPCPFLHSFSGQLRLYHLSLHNDC